MTFVLFPYLFGFQAEAAETGNYVKIGLKYGSTAVTSCTLESDDGFFLGTASDRNFEEGMPLPGYTALTISNESGSIVVRDPSGTLISSDLGSSGCIMTNDYGGDDATFSLDDIPYRDGLMFRANSGGTLTVINYLTLEHYIYGVLNAELNYTNPIEALKAQAVAARSFGELNLGKHSSDGFDFCTTTHCQVYKGYSGEYPAILEAVDDTKGEMLRYNGDPVTAYYFKNSGGYTQNAEDVWSGNTPYLRSVKDEFCPSYPWSTSLSFEIIQTRLESAGYQPGNIVTVSITDRNATGAVSELKITGTDSTVYLRKEKIRSVLGATIIKSNMFSLADSTASEGTKSWNISNGSSTVAYDTEVYVINGNGEVEVLDDETYGISGTGTAKLGSSSTATETVTGGTVVFNGSGYGHGVGMPQDSAVEMAKQGFTYDEILKYYFTDVEIE
jgi:stage II sporulation protein D